MTFHATLLWALVLSCLGVRIALGQALSEAEEIRLLKERLHVLEAEARWANALPSASVEQGSSIAIFLCGAFCALWAQNTGRSAWLWFFLGCIFSVITLIVLLTKNADDRFDRRVFGRTVRDVKDRPGRSG